MCEIKHFIVYQCNTAGTVTGLFVEAVGCEIVHFENLTDRGIYGKCSAIGYVGALNTWF